MTASASNDLLDRVLAGHAPAFALLYRPESAGRDVLDVMIGEVTEHGSLADIPVTNRPRAGRGAGHDVLALVPYRQLSERGFAAKDDNTPLVAITITEQATMPLADVLARIPHAPAKLVGGRFEPDDAGYAEVVKRVVHDEIGAGEGANFVIKRSYRAEITDFTTANALFFLRRLIEREHGTYWTFLIHTGARTLLGATPERHITLAGGTAVMNPISGTYRYPAGGPTLRGVLDFLADAKETDELYMVLDEELKMMGRVCNAGGRVVGPYLKEMARLAHTEYFIEGRTNLDAREILRETMFAPTVMGSPVESAARVIDRYERDGRGYYSGIAALIGRNANGEQSLDSAILIRTADIGLDGELTIPVGATLVRHSDPQAEVAETAAKAAALLAAMRTGEDGRFAADPGVQAALRRRNHGIADFWLRERDNRTSTVAALDGLTALVVDAEDTFTTMLAQQLQALGLVVMIRRFDEHYDPAGADLLVLGPGPGDPRAANHPKIAHLASALDEALASSRPLLAVCLSHQVLSRRLGFDLVRRHAPNQGVQREIDLFGQRERVGFYNTFAAHSATDRRDVEGVGLIQISRDQQTGEVHALRGPSFASMQFHAESVLTVDGPRIIADAIMEVLHVRVHVPGAV
ncbi:anthranilate synthase family protein [Micromonospora sp. NPDC049559]|uniref:anthranilate synthase family protein n=1 Tax=Micromonospora sp. NPDC049559 TaxID=3155923 RepID=UPI0034269242